MVVLTDPYFWVTSIAAYSFTVLVAVIMVRIWLTGFHRFLSHNERLLLVIFMLIPCINVLVSIMALIDILVQAEKRRYKPWWLK